MGLCRCACAAKQPLVLAAADDSPVGVKLSQKGGFESACGKAGVKGILVDASGDGAALAGAVESASNSGMPDVVAVAGTGVAGVGRTAGVADATLKALLHGKKPDRAAAKKHGLDRLQGRSVVVTGGAQGFGKGIADELADEGAAIVVADLNEDVGKKAADDLNGRFGNGTAVFAKVDVTSKASLDACVLATVRAFGGVDMLISNAGILKAGGIEELDEKAFDLVTAVNYKAFFLCVQAVTPVMKLQNKCCPAHSMDIIQINSKSGLEGSNRNFAYAGSKFGGIGLTQSFALELVEYGVKVNAICPGNYYEGPLWSDPEKGLFVQYLRAGKVKGAKTVDDVKAFYLSKSPIRRGCLPKDVATAILYLHEQEYETGQALPVTGGQVMLG